MGKLFDGIKRVNNFNEIFGYREPVSIVVSNSKHPKRCLMLDEHTMTLGPKPDNQNRIKMQRNQSFKNPEFVPSSTDVSAQKANSYDDSKRELKLDLRYRDGREDRHKEVMLSQQQLNRLMEMLDSFKSDNSSYVPDHHKIKTADSGSSSSLASTIREMKTKAKVKQGSLSKETADRIRTFLSKSESFMENGMPKDCHTSQPTRSKLSSELQNMKSLSNAINKSGNIFLTNVNSITSKSGLNNVTTHNRSHINDNFPPIDKRTDFNLASNNQNVEPRRSPYEDFDPDTMIDFLYHIERAIEGGHLDPSIFYPRADDFRSPRGRGLSSPELLLTSNASNSSPNSHHSRCSSPPAMERCDETETIGDSERILKNCVKVSSPSEGGFKLFKKNLTKTDSQAKVGCPNASLSKENISELGIRLMGMSKRIRKPRLLRPKVRRERVLRETKISDVRSLSDQLLMDKSRQINNALDDPIEMLGVDDKPKPIPLGDEALLRSKKNNNNTSKITKSKNERRKQKLKKFEGLSMPEKYLTLQKFFAHPTLNSNQGLCFSRSNRAPIKADTPVWRLKKFSLVTRNVYPGKVNGMAILKETMYFIIENRDKLFYLPLISLVMNKLYWERKYPYMYNPKDIVSNSGYLFVLLESREILKINPNIKNSAVYRWRVVTDALTDIVTLSLLNNDNLIAVCRNPSCLVEFNSTGETVRNISLPVELSGISHVIEVDRGRFAVSCTSPTGVFMVDSNGNFLLANKRRPSVCCYSGLLVTPLHLATDSNGFVYVADYADNRIIILSNQLRFETSISFEHFSPTCPNRLLYDRHQRLMHFACSRNARWVLASFKTLVT